MWIRPETERDRKDVSTLLISTFGTPSEAELAEALRATARPLISLVVVVEGQIVGHIMFSPVALSGHPGIKLMGLGPLAVASEYQRQGIGSALVWSGLVDCRQLSCGAVVVVGHPAYYRRFGFSPAAGFGLRCEMCRKRYSWSGSWNLVS